MSDSAEKDKRELIDGSPKSVSILFSVGENAGLPHRIETVGRYKCSGVDYIRKDISDKRIAELDADLAEEKSSFDVRWKADMRAIKRWQGATGKTLTWPDHADLCVWLMDELGAARNDALNEAAASVFHPEVASSIRALKLKP